MNELKCIYSQTRELQNEIKNQMSYDYKIHTYIVWLSPIRILTDPSLRTVMVYVLKITFE